MRFPGSDEIKRLREKYPPGTKLRLIHMNDVQAPQEGTIGKVTYVDDIGSVHVNWENGSSLAVIPGEDLFETF